MTTYRYDSQGRLASVHSDHDTTRVKTPETTSQYNAKRPRRLRRRTPAK